MKGVAPSEVADVLLAKRVITAMGFTTPCWIWTGGYFNDGYGRKNLTHLEGRERSYLVHRLAAHVWLAFDISSPMLVCHRCDVKGCFNPDHLFIGTHLDNTRDMLNKGRHRFNRGSQVPVSKLTETQVLDIRRAIGDGQTQRSLAITFNVTPSAINCIHKRRNWSHI